jgi:glycosyltransferase involved in cell wall biosynthesis
VLFVGQFIPLHGIDTIIRAARLSSSDPLEWVIIGRGQEEARIRHLLADSPPERLTWRSWVPYDQLTREIADADVCLGIFGSSTKAACVIPNKVFQILACGRCLVTRDSPAIRELIPTATPGVRLVPPADPTALLQAVLDLAQPDAPRPPVALSHRFSEGALGAALRDVIDEAVRSRHLAAEQLR